MWLWLGIPLDGTRNVHVLLPRVASLVRFAADVDGRLATLGLDGLSGALGLHRKLRNVLDPISSAQLDELRNTIAGLEQALTEMEARIAALRRLKEQLRA